MTNKTTHFDLHCSDLFECDALSAEVDRNGELELTFEVETRGCCASWNEERSLHLSREDALAFARFVLTEFGEGE